MKKPILLLFGLFFLSPALKAQPKISKFELTRIKNQALNRLDDFRILLGRLGSSDTKTAKKKDIQNELVELFIDSALVQVATKVNDKPYYITHLVRDYLDGVRRTASSERYSRVILWIDNIRLDTTLRDTSLIIKGKMQHALYAKFKFYQHLEVEKTGRVLVIDRELPTRIINRATGTSTIFDDTYKHGTVIFIDNKHFGGAAHEALLGNIGVEEFRIKEGSN